MKRFLIPALLVSALAVGAPPALATPATYEGGCTFGAVSDPTPDGNLGGQGVFTGAVAYAVTLYDTNNPEHNPISADVSCVLTVNSVPQDGIGPDHVTVAGANSDVVTYTKQNPTDVVELCTVIENWSDGTPDVNDCGPATTTTIPPDEVIQLINDIFDLIADTTEPLDPITCDALQAAGVPAAAQSTYATTGVWIDSDDCDIWVNGPIWENIFITPARVIDFSPYGDPYTGP